MNRRTFIMLLGGAVAWPLAARAQQQRRPLIGFLGPTSPAASGSRMASFVRRLRELGWIEGSTVAIEYRWAEGATALLHQAVVPVCVPDASGQLCTICGVRLRGANGKLSTCLLCLQARVDQERRARARDVP